MVDSSNANARMSTKPGQLHFESFKNSFGGNIIVPIYGSPVKFGADYSSFDQKRQEVFSEYKYDLTVDQSRHYVQFKFSAQGYNAYTQCLQDHVLDKEGIHIYIRNPTETSFVADVLWRPPAGPARPKQVDASVQVGTAPPVLQRLSIQPNGIAPIIVERDPGKDTRVVVTDNGAYGDDLLVPATPRVPPPLPVSCFWRHTLQFMNNYNDSRLRAMFPKIYSTFSDGESRVRALAQYGYYYAAEGGGGRDWNFDIGNWGVPQSGALEGNVTINPLNPGNFGEFSFQARRGDDRHIVVRAYSNKGGSVTQISIEFNFNLTGQCPAVPR